MNNRKVSTHLSQHTELGSIHGPILAVNGALITADTGLADADGELTESVSPFP